MRQADSTIKGYLYQFNKSIYEILSAEDDESIILEGVIEDIDIQSPSGTKTIQCKYHEDSKYLISNVAVPILEMLCHYCESAYLGKTVSYILYSYYAENVNEIDMESFLEFLQSTSNKDILCKYFHRIYSIPDPQMLKLANKERKSQTEKDELVNYYKSNRAALSMRVCISDFWNVFTYIQAKQFDVLKEETIHCLSAITDAGTARSLYYPNAFSLIATLSSKHSEQERTITKNKLVSFLTEQKTLLVNRWSLEAFDKGRLLKIKKLHLSSSFSSNADVRAFLFTDQFLDKNESGIIAFIQEYISKYFKKPRLQKPPIFVFGNNHFALMQSVLLELYKYQRSVNTGLVGNNFIQDSFINNRNCAPDFVCKMALLQHIDVNVLEKCQVNQLYVLGKCEEPLTSVNFFTEELDMADINIVRYLISLTKALEV